MARRNMRTRIKVEGAEDVIRALQKANAEMERELRNLISEAAEIVFREADARVPIKSSKARNTLRIEIGETRKGYFYANVVIGDGTGKEDPFYIAFYELGTSRQPARPFMRPSLDKSRRKIRQHLIAGLRSVIAKQGR
ncbi:hypothetical protein JCM9140_3136 [Halalkalibacter wakoensis JCM 9140]|uniref:Phage protein n=1 Tax=Halalkalibacter wakoensis JCM 9140 TaxID=1236970 RepID=W4Q503_9BACI|nr:HK97-gp10 family putative phage morphogenesis protein [Halalkalibacter wakoensis]GAE27025.1 hypothetical protein JCM9140_3136 [Halalkalibacter wakoensis JCM 9140]